MRIFALAKNPVIRMKYLAMSLLFTLALVVAPWARSQDLPEARRAVLESASALEQDVERMSMALWTYAETALLETRSSAFLADILERDGFEVVRDVSGMPTAFVATYGSGMPVLGILAEYDALPGVGNAVEPRRKPRADEITSGHGCGHNLFGAASVAAARALKTVMQQQGIRGTLKLYGSPAEETGIGKVYMARDGVFDDADIVLDWHPGLTTEVRNQSGRAVNSFTVTFYGQAAHAAADPWNGRSALDAVELMNFGVNLMREHVRPTTRIHYVIPEAGEAPNVVPERAKVWYFVRDVDRKSVLDWYGWILKIAEGAAMGTRTTHEVLLHTGIHEYNLNRPLQEAIQANLEFVGAPPFNEEDQSFARALQSHLGIEEVGFSTAVKPLAEGPEPARGGSTDVAEVSYIAPTAGFSVATAAAGIPWHSWAATACHGTNAGVKGAVVATKVLALTGADVLLDANLRNAAQDFFAEKTGGAPYVSPLPLGQQVQLPEGLP